MTSARALLRNVWEAPDSEVGFVITKRYANGSLGFRQGLEEKMTKRDHEWSNYMCHFVAYIGEIR